MGDILEVALSEVVDCRYVVTVLEEPVHDVASDEARPSGYQSPDDLTPGAPKNELKSIVEVVGSEERLPAVVISGIPVAFDMAAW